MQGHKTWIDSLKGLAILFILAVHCGTQGLPEKFARIVVSGGMWVQLFLLLSVMLNMNSFDRATQGGMLSRKDMLLQIADKFARLAPLYFLAMAFGAVFSGGAPYYLGSEGHITCGNALSHVLFLNGLFPHYANSILGVEWYIGVLALFYLSLPMLFRRLSDLMRAFVAFAISIPVCHFLTAGAYAFILPHVIDKDVLTAYFSLSWPIASIPTILFGVFFWHLRKLDVSCSRGWKKVGAYAALMIFALLYYGMIKGETMVYYVSHRLLFAIVFAFLIAAAPHIASPIFDNAVFGFLGRHSYGIFLFHMMFISVLPEKGTWMGWLQTYFSCLVGSIVLTLLAEKLVDNPCQRLWRKLRAIK